VEPGEYVRRHVAKMRRTTGTADHVACFLLTISYQGENTC
jgi:hypothetical protein